MCGILGIVAPPEQQVALSRAQIESLRDTMRPRGPDGVGLLMQGRMAFAHCRLAIRDRVGGAQPWSSEDGRCVLVYNGELYNDAELRTELEAAGYCFRTQCDTETVLATYLHWGEDCVSRLRGMFAFGIFDFRDDSLLLVRDRFGVKPLFMTEAGGQFVFASSIATLLAHPAVVKQPNWTVVSHYLSTFRLTLGSETIYEGIYQLQPGQLLRLRDGKPEVRRYWDYPTSVDDSIDFLDAKSRLEHELDSAVQLRLQSDVPVGMFLSGGVDSSTIACHVRRHHSASMLGQCGGGEAGGGNSDFEFAAKCAAFADLEYEEVRVPEAAYRERWLSLAQEYRTPVSTPSDVIINCLARAMKPSVGVVLGGEGADELLCGYSVQHWSGKDYDARRAIDSGQWAYGTEAARSFLTGLTRQYGRDTFASPTDHYFALNSLIPTAAKPALLQDWVWERTEGDRRMLAYYDDFFNSLPGIPTSQQHLQLLHRVNLESLLGRLDSATMQASLEARVPFTDHLLVEEVFRMPHRHKIAVDPEESWPYLPSGDLEARGSLMSKRPLRSLAMDIMPPELAQRKKASFPTPVQNWLAGPWQSWAAHELKSSTFAQAVLRPEAIDQLANNVPAAGMWLWPLLNLAIWGDSEFN